jgi:TM2 domain-containing membrane protein YozV
MINKGLGNASWSLTTINLASRYRTGIVLSVFVAGFGQIYLGRFKRGISILVLGTSLVLTTLYFLGWPAAIIASVIFWTWNVADSHRLGKQLLLVLLTIPLLCTNSDLHKPANRLNAHSQGTIRTAHLWRCRLSEIR